MEGLLILLLFPLAWPFLAKRIFHSTINWTEMLIQIGVITLLTFGIWSAGKYGQTVDTEVWNGYVTAKDRDHGHYEQPYSCNCRTVSCGKNCSTTTCDTCYEDHYTVTWTADTTVGNVQFDHLDRTSRSVYSAPDPAAYKRCKVGEPASREHTYTNYIQAVPNSLFHDVSSAASPYQDKVPAYPRVYDFYRINRVVGDLSNHPMASQINENLNNALKTLGKEKQVNIVIILTDIDDPSYRYVVERAWLGGEKNDAIVIVGLDGNRITWSDTITWALNKGNELFNVKMRDGVIKLGTLDPTTFSSFVVSTIKSTYDRPEMTQFAYLEDEIDPPGWVIILAVIIAIGGSISLTFVFHHYEVEDIVGQLFTAKDDSYKKRNWK